MSPSALRYESEPPETTIAIYPIYCDEDGYESIRVRMEQSAETLPAIGLTQADVRDVHLTGDEVERVTAERFAAGTIGAVHEWYGENKTNSPTSPLLDGDSIDTADVFLVRRDGTKALPSNDPHVTGRDRRVVELVSEAIAGGVATARTLPPLDDLADEFGEGGGDDR